ncbi:MAG: glycoside hydrolase family 5 protein [Lachnospiraceae bacterium]
MKKIRNILLLLVFCFLILGRVGIKFYHDNKVIAIINHLGAGINIGNSLDVYNISSWLPNATIEEYETAWKNPLITAENFVAIKKAGFDSVRIPISWGDHLLADGTIDPEWLARVTAVVDYAITAELCVVINTHHEKWMDLANQNNEQITDTLCNVWRQISKNFENYNEQLFFEGMNEPRSIGTLLEWGGGTKEEREFVNHLNNKFVETVRSGEGYNKTRYLMIGTYGNSGKEEAVKDLIIPKDNKIIVSIHAYIPYHFTQDKEGSNSWDVNKQEDTEGIDSLMKTLEVNFIKKGIPVVITEFACADKNNLEERLEWIDFFTKEARRSNIAYMWWDNGDEYKILNRELSSWVYPEIVKRLVDNFKK